MFDAALHTGTSEFALYLAPFRPHVAQSRTSQEAQTKCNCVCKFVASSTTPFDQCKVNVAVVVLAGVIVFLICVFL